MKPQKNLYSVEFSNESEVTVVAVSFDEALKKSHEHSTTMKEPAEVIGINLVASIDIE